MQKKIGHIFTLLIVCFTMLCACSIDYNDNPPLPSSDISTGTIIAGDANEPLFIKLDQYYGIVFPVGGIPSKDHKWKIGDRIMIEFYPIDEEVVGEFYNRKIEIIWTGLIKTQNPLIITSPNQDTLGKDSFFEDSRYANTFWISDNYLSVIPYFFYSNYDKHTVSLLASNPYEYCYGEEIADTINFELKHNAHNDLPRTLTPTKVFSFRLSELDYSMGVSGKDSVTLAIKIPVITQINSTTTEFYLTKYATFKRSLN